jgi:hypothetical protein
VYGNGAAFVPALSGGSSAGGVSATAPAKASIDRGSTKSSSIIRTSIPLSDASAFLKSRVPAEFDVRDVLKAARQCLRQLRLPS